MFLHPKFNYSIRSVFNSYSIEDVNDIPDGKSERSFCSSQSCLESTTDLSFKRAFNPHSRGYDCGNSKNWIVGEYTRVHRDADIINAMREWLYSTPEMNMINEELYSRDEQKAVCDEKCLICNEESKREDKCIFCDSNKDYYPVMEMKGSEEYYEYYKKDVRVERFYFSNRDKAFLPCYETCRYCNELGNINDHKSITCDYNLVKKPGTKETALTFNCVTDFAYSFYFTESGQYKYISNSICPQDRNIYVEAKKKYVSSCKEEAPFIYLFNGNCVEKYPDNYISDNINNICKAKDSSYTLDSKIETFSHLYSLSMLNTFAKRYRDEYFYTDRDITKIINENYIIYIFKDFNCLGQLNIDKPDFRNINKYRYLEENVVTQNKSSCYTKFQNALNTEDNLIVVYLEDGVDLVKEKGYLLYNSFNGTKTSFETICGDGILVEKEDETANEENADNRYMKLIYLNTDVIIKDDDNQTTPFCPENQAPLYIYSKCYDINSNIERFYYNSIFNIFLPC